MKQYIFGVDIGGTSVKLGLFQTDGTLLSKWEIPTNIEENGSHILPDINTAIQEKIKEYALDKQNILGVGMGVPGPVEKNGIMHKAINLNWEEFNIVKTAESIFGFPVKAGNDATIATLGELWQGAGKGLNSMVMFTIGTGVGGGVVIDEKIVAGTFGSAGELGHITVNPTETTSCNCGKKGCLEQYASATGIVNYAKKCMTEKQYETSLSLETLSTKEIVSWAEQNDPLAKHIIEHTGELLGMAFSYAGCFLDPDVILIGGGVSKAGDILLNPIRTAYQKHVFHASKTTPILIATLGNDAGIYGSAKQFL